MRERTVNVVGECAWAQRGQAMVEYLLIVGVVALVMFVPTPLTNNMAPADLLSRALRVFFRGHSFLISVF